MAGSPCKDAPKHSLTSMNQVPAENGAWNVKIVSCRLLAPGVRGSRMLTARERRKPFLHPFRRWAVCVIGLASEGSSRRGVNVQLNSTGPCRVSCCGCSRWHSWGQATQRGQLRPHRRSWWHGWQPAAGGLAVSVPTMGNLADNSGHDEVATL